MEIQDALFQHFDHDDHHAPTDHSSSRQGGDGGETSTSTSDFGHRLENYFRQIQLASDRNVAASMLSTYMGMLTALTLHNDNDDDGGHHRIERAQTLVERSRLIFLAVERRATMKKVHIFVFGAVERPRLSISRATAQCMQKYVRRHGYDESLLNDALHRVNYVLRSVGDEKTKKKKNANTASAGVKCEDRRVESATKTIKIRTDRLPAVVRGVESLSYFDERLVANFDLVPKVKYDSRTFSQAHDDQDGKLIRKIVLDMVEEFRSYFLTLNSDNLLRFACGYAMTFVNRLKLDVTPRFVRGQLIDVTFMSRMIRGKLIWYGTPVILAAKDLTHSSSQHPPTFFFPPPGVRTESTYADHIEIKVVSNQKILQPNVRRMALGTESTNFFDSFLSAPLDYVSPIARRQWSREIAGLTHGLGPQFVDYRLAGHLMVAGPGQKYVYHFAPGENRRRPLIKSFVFARGSRAVVVSVAKAWDESLPKNVDLAEMFVEKHIFDDLLIKLTDVKKVVVFNVDLSGRQTTSADWTSYHRRVPYTDPTHQFSGTIYGRIRSMQAENLAADWASPASFDAKQPRLLPTTIYKSRVQGVVIGEAEQGEHFLKNLAINVKNLLKASSALRRNEPELDSSIRAQAALLDPIFSYVRLRVQYPEGSAVPSGDNAIDIALASVAYPAALESVKNYRHQNVYVHSFAAALLRRVVLEQSQDYSFVSYSYSPPTSYSPMSSSQASTSLSYFPTSSNYLLES